MAEHPSAKALGYFHSFRYADVKEDFAAKLISPLLGAGFRTITSHYL